MEQLPQTIDEIFPCFDQLTNIQQNGVREDAKTKRFAPGETLHSGGEDCAGLFLVRRGQLRVFILSETGKEVTLYRLFSWDICLFSASCIMKNIHFDMHVQAEKETEVFIVPAELYEGLMKVSLPLADYTNQLMSARFSDVMWIMEQILFKSFDSRLAAFLLDQSVVDGAETLEITHETIARHMGSAREVVTRMLKYLAEGEMVRLSRGKITLLDQEKLAALAAQ